MTFKISDNSSIIGAYKPCAEAYKGQEVYGIQEWLIDINSLDELCNFIKDLRGSIIMRANYSDPEIIEIKMI